MTDLPNGTAGLDIDIFSMKIKPPSDDRKRWAVIRFQWHNGQWRRIRRLTGPMRYHAALAALEIQMQRRNLPRADRGKTMQVFPGFIVAQLAEAARKLAAQNPREAITIDGHQSNGAHCIHQVRARIEGDPTIYRVIIAPANAPIFINDDKRPIAEAFPLPLGDC